jgi:hypothetical protein
MIIRLDPCEGSRQSFQVKNPAPKDLISGFQVSGKRNREAETSVFVIPFSPLS